MANCLLNCRKMRPQPLCPEMQLGLTLTLWLRVNEKPPLVFSELQSRSSAGTQHDPLPFGIEYFRAFGIEYFKASTSGSLASPFLRFWFLPSAPSFESAMNGGRIIQVNKECNWWELAQGRKLKSQPLFSNFFRRIPRSQKGLS